MRVYNEKIGIELEDFFKKNVNLIHHICKLYRAKAKQLKVDYDDIFQIGSEAFVKVYSNFDPDLGFKFATYAVPFIKGRINQYLRDRSHILRPGRAANDLMARIKKEGLDESKPQQIADELGMDLKQVERLIMNYLNSSGIIRFDSRPVMSDEGDEDFYAIIPNKKSSDYSSALVDDFMSKLDDRERMILELLMLGYKQQAIANRLSISQAQVSRILRLIRRKYLAYDEGKRF